MRWKEQRNEHSLKARKKNFSFESLSLSFEKLSNFSYASFFFFIDFVFNKF